MKSIHDGLAKKIKDAYSHHLWVSFFTETYPFIELLGKYNDHDWAVIVVFLTLLIEISTNETRIQLTDVHQMRVIHLNTENDYTSHVVSSRSTFFYHATRTDICSYIYIYINIRVFVIVIMSKWNFLRAQCVESISFEHEIETLLIRSTAALLFLLNRVLLVALMNWW
jgi:hypothetical protein